MVTPRRQRRAYFFVLALSVLAFVSGPMVTTRAELRDGYCFTDEETNRDYDNWCDDCPDTGYEYYCVNSSVYYNGLCMNPSGCHLCCSAFFWSCGEAYDCVHETDLGPCEMNAEFCLDING